MCLCGGQTYLCGGHVEACGRRLSLALPLKDDLEHRHRRINGAHAHGTHTCTYVHAGTYMCDTRHTHNKTHSNIRMAYGTREIAPLGEWMEMIPTRLMSQLRRPKSRPTESMHAQITSTHVRQTTHAHQKSGKAEGPLCKAKHARTEHRPEPIVRRA